MSERVEYIRTRLQTAQKVCNDYCIPNHDILYLISELERVKQERDEQKEFARKLYAGRELMHDELRRVEQERDKYRQEAINEKEQSDIIVSEREELIIENEEIRKKLDKAIEGLSFYANEKTYDIRYGFAIEKDSGKKARSILSEMEIEP